MIKSKARGASSGRAGKRRGGPRAPALTAAEVLEAFRASRTASALVLDGSVAIANEAFARTLALAPAKVTGRRLETLLPPDDGPLALPRAGGARSYRTHLDGVPARVDLSASPAPRPDGRLVVTAVVTAVMEAYDTAADRALLTLSRDLADARTEDQLTAAVARALEVLFPGRSFCIRLVDPETLALTTLYARGRLRPQARSRLALRRAALRKTGLSVVDLETAGLAVTEEDEPLFEGSDLAMAVPLAVSGALFGILNLEYARSAPGDPESDGPLLFQVANHTALSVRNLRSIEDLTYLKNYLEDLIEHANALIAVVNRCREVIVWNAALVKLTGLGRDEMLGDDVLKVVPEEERARVEDALLRSFEGEHVDGAEVRLLRRGGGEARISLNTAPIHGASGEVEGVIAIGQDLTRLRNLEAAAEHAERLAGIGRLAAGVVHELNNPLTAVTMYSDVLLEKLTLAGHDAGDVEKIRTIKDSGQRIQKLARDLIAYARPTGIRTEPCDLAGVMEEAARMAKPALKEADAAITRQFDPAPPVEGNRASLVQIFVNLITNAAQALKEGGGTIVLGVRAEPGSVVATVADDGSGMSPEIRAKAFEPFFTTRPGRGIGLGLPIVEGIVKRHGGTISVESAPGQGATVTVTLPCKKK